MNAHSKALADLEELAREAFEKLLAEQKFILGMPKLAGARPAFISGFLAARSALSADAEPVAEVPRSLRKLVKQVLEQWDKDDTYSINVACRDIDAFYASSPGAAEAGEASYVHTVPDHCDRIVWRGQYVHLPRPEARESVPKAEAGEAVAMVWHEGPPPFPQDQEWFIAETTYGDRVVLRSLDEGRQHKGNYDFKTADGTYLKAELVKRWMQFPDCEYLPPAKAEATARRAWALMLVAAPQSGADIPTATIKHENGETEVGLLGRMAGAQTGEPRAAAPQETTK